MAVANGSAGTGPPRLRVTTLPVVVEVLDDDRSSVVV